MLSAVALAAVPNCSYKRQAVDVYPDRCLKVPYELATGHSSCLVAAVVMAANYLDGRQRLREPDVVQQMRADHLDETRPGDVQAWLDRQPDDLSLITLRGTLSDAPPTGLHYWLLQRGYPVVCVVNKTGQSADYNHAVVVIGIDTAAPGAADGQPQVIHYLDPASPKRVEQCGRDEFETWWARCQNVMGLVVRRPRSATAG